MIITGKQLVGYSRSGKGTQQFESQVTGENGKPFLFYEATTEEVATAVQKAQEAFDVSRGLSGKQLAAFLEAMAAELILALPTVIAVTQQETGLPAKRLEGEMDRTTKQIQMFATLLTEGSWVNAIIDPAIPDRAPLPKADIRQMQRPIGPVAVFGASNFPYAFSVAGGDTISALAAGCPVVYKAHPGHPVTSELIGECILKAAVATNMPEGIFSLVQGTSHETGRALVTHPAIKAVAFTGSFNGGKALYDVAAQRPEPVPVYAEMGSVNPVFVLPGMLQEKGTAIAQALVASNTAGTGQFCTNPGIIVSLKAEETAKFLADFCEGINGAAGSRMLTDNIYRSYTGGVERLRQIAGMQAIGAGTATAENNSAIPHSFLISGNAFLSEENMYEEVFGPASIQVMASNTNELYEIADKMPGQLTVTVWGTTADLENFKSLIFLLEKKAGRLLLNSVPTGVEVTHAMMHGGPYPATTDSKYTSVGSTAIYRFTRPVCYQGFPEFLLPEALRNENSLNIWRQVNGGFNKDSL
ncbi:aldehyde dehydrogenase (NADP(+)) [Chitinophaga sp. MM2321]|uniref:aldehyde dehydrogenase (NADP(+)) n=1 Tax=Chitinophaga sp. MM2321 TaxID=3137178 RepID=UPI0032D57A54